MTAATTSTALATVQPVFTEAERLALAGFLAGCRGLTRGAYTLDLRQFNAWCCTRSLSLFAVRRADIETFARDLEAKGRAAVTRRLCTIAGSCKYAVEEELLEHSPAAHVRRPRLDYESHATALDRNELGALLVAAGLGPPAEHALISLLALNGLRVSEATGADIEHLGLERGHRTLVITRKGGKVVTIPLAPRTARAIDLAVGERTSAVRAERLLEWAQAWPERTWAVEGAGGLGHLLDWQLLSAGERVLDVPPKLAARVRLLATGNINKNDPDDARSVAVAALRSADVREARRDDHAAVLKVWSKRYRDLGRARTQVACRLHQVLCELIPGGVPGEITAGQAARILESVTPAGAVDAARWELAAELTEDLRGVDARIRETRTKAAAAVRAAGTSLTGLFGVGPVIAAAVIGDVRDVSRFPGRDRFAACNGTAPSRCPPAAGRPAGCRGAATAGSTMRSTWSRSPRSATGTPRAAHTTTRNWPKAKPRKKRCARSTARSATPSSPACRKTPGAPLRRRAREGNRGTTLQPGRPAHTPTTGSSGKPLPGLPPTLRLPLLPFPRSCPPVRASRRVKDRAQPGRAAAPAGRPRRGRERADNARCGKREVGTPLTFKQRGVRSGRSADVLASNPLGA